MKERIIFLSLVILIVFTAATCSRTQETVITPGSTSVAEGEKITSDGKTLLEQCCTRCHTTERIYLHKSYRMSKEQWKQIIDRMIAKGANVSESERDLIIKYLLSE